MMFSYMLMGAGSSAVSARPSLPTTISTSGMAATRMSSCFTTSVFCSTPACGMLVGISRKLPSSSEGMNSLPTPGKACAIVLHGPVRWMFQPALLARDETGEKMRPNPNQIITPKNTMKIGMERKAALWSRHQRRIRS